MYEFICHGSSDIALVKCNELSFKLSLCIIGLRETNRNEKTSIDTTASEQLVCDYLLGDLVDAVGSPILRLLSNRIGISSGVGVGVISEQRCNTICTILRRVIGTLDIDRQSHAANRIVSVILESCSSEIENSVHRCSAQRNALLCAVFVYVSPKAHIFTNMTQLDNNVTMQDSHDLVMNCLHLALADIPLISKGTDPDEKVQADHLLSLLMNKVSRFPR